MTPGRQTARSIFHHALAASSIPAAFDRASLGLHVPWIATTGIYAVAVGKAALPMLETLRSRACLTA